jgi:pimeloyl-ACP methyl ester carboxylesterase
MLAYERIGAGPPLVLLHGVGHRRQAWYPIVDQVARHRELILVDLPGHGESDPLVLDGRTAITALREDLATFFGQQGLDRPHVAGNSLGGRMALEAAAAGMARSATTLSPAGFWRGDAGFAYTRCLFGAIQKLSDRLGARGPRLVTTSAGRAVLFSWIAAHPGRIGADAALGDLAAFRTARLALRAVLNEATPFSASIPADVPVTVAWASRDVVLLPYQARVARAALPTARHVKLPGCGHVPMSDDPGLVAGVLLRGSEG